MKRVFSGIMFALLLTGLLVLAFNVQPARASGTIYIRPNGDVDPPTAPIQRNGDTYTFTADIYFSPLVVERDNIVVDGAYYMLKGPGSGDGVTLSGRSYVTIKNIEIKAFGQGICLSGSSNSSIVGNSITNNSGNGIDLTGSSYNSIVGNNILNNGGEGVSIHSGYWGTPSGNYNSIVGNIITNNGGYGVSLSAWSTWNYYVCSDNSIVRNNIANNSGGIQLSGSGGSSISYNSIVGNKITNHTYGILLSGSSPYNSIYHNDFVNNTHQVYTFGLVNVWDNGYPYGGNYWSSYTGIDLYKGRYQNIPGGDGIGDTPHVIDSNNEDRYPFMNPTGWWNNTGLDFSLTPSPAYVGQIVTMLGNLVDMLGHPINNAKVDVFLNGAFKGNLLTNSSGWFKASARVDALGTYVIKAVYSGSAIYKPSNHIETLTVYLKIDTMVRFTLSPNPATVGQTVTMLGNLTDINNNPIGNAPLELYTKKDTGSWQYAGTISTNSSGWFKAAGKITSTGTYQVAVLYRGSYKYKQSYHIETLTVNPSPLSETASTEAHWLKTG
jgi:parallel beta-helix repeat protein